MSRINPGCTQRAIIESRKERRRGCSRGVGNRIFCGNSRGIKRNLFRWCVVQTRSGATRNKRFVASGSGLGFVMGHPRAVSILSEK